MQSQIKSVLMVFLSVFGALAFTGEAEGIAPVKHVVRESNALTIQTESANDVEVARVQAHLDGAVELLENAHVGELTVLQRQRRDASIAALRRYRDAAQFPKNTDYPMGLRPTFVDDQGTHCALAYLIAESGEHEVVKYVANTRNHAYVRELTDEPALLAWLQSSGISVEEAARIQPDYAVVPATCMCPRERARVIADTRARNTEVATVAVEYIYGDATLAPSGIGSIVVAEHTGRLPRVLLLGTSDGEWLPWGYSYFAETIDCPSCGRDGVSTCSSDGPLPKGYVIDALLSEDCVEFINNNDPGSYMPRNRPVENPPIHRPKNYLEFPLAALGFAIALALLGTFALIYQRRRQDRQ